MHNKSKRALLCVSMVVLSVGAVFAVHQMTLMSDGGTSSIDVPIRDITPNQQEHGMEFTTAVNEGANVVSQDDAVSDDTVPPEGEAPETPLADQLGMSSSVPSEGTSSTGLGIAAGTLADASLESVVSLRMIRDNFCHGPLPADKIRYIVLHDTESGTDNAEAIANSWGGGHIASHFIVDKQGRVIQCVPIDCIAHHAGNADYGSNDRYEIWAERDDEIGRTGSGDYAMNAWSIGIEMVHEHNDGPYPEAQLEAVDRLIAAIDHATGCEPRIIDHKAWAGSRKQDVSDNFPLVAYQHTRRHLA